MKLGRKNIWPKHEREALRSPWIPVIHSLRHFSNLQRIPPTHSRAMLETTPGSARRKIGSGTCSAKFARAFLQMCVREKEREGREERERGRERERERERFSTERRAIAVCRVSQNEKTRSTNFLDALGWSIDVDFEWAGTRNFMGVRPASEKTMGGGGGRGRRRKRSNSWLS